jgi:hypothetical protein
VARLNAVLWWLQHGKGRDGGTFVDIEQLETMLKSKQGELAPEGIVE